MNDDLERLAAANRRYLTKADREFVKAAAEVVNEVRLAKLEVDGAFELGGHINDGLEDLDAKRRSCAASQELDALRVEIELTAFRQARRIQNNLYTQW